MLYFFRNKSLEKENTRLYGYIQTLKSNIEHLKLTHGPFTAIKLSKENERLNKEHIKLKQLFHETSKREEYLMELETEVKALRFAVQTLREKYEKPDVLLEHVFDLIDKEQNV